MRSNNSMRWISDGCIEHLMICDIEKNNKKKKRRKVKALEITRDYDIMD